jgi:hypothetical protein
MAAQRGKRNRQQHFVTASYLAGFTPEGKRKSKLFVYVRNSEKMFRAVPDEVAKSRYYYDIPLETGGFDDSVDKRITALEGQAMPILRKLLARNYNLSVFERALLAYLIAFQEFRTPWARANFQKIHLSVTEHLMQTAAKVPGHFERLLHEADGNVDASTAANELRDALRNERIKPRVQPHAGIDLIVPTGQALGNIYTQMQWIVFHAVDAEFLTSDTPVMRRDPGYKGGFYGGGLMSPTAKVWFPLSKRACLLIRHDEVKLRKFSEFLEAGKLKEAEALKAQLPAIAHSVFTPPFVNALNCQTILNADRFIYSPFESPKISRLFKGESHNLRINMSPPPSRKKETK